MRLLEILFYLLKINSKTTIKQLAQMFNVSEKTIQRDLDKLSYLGIPIISYRGVTGGIEIDRNYIIAKYVLTDRDYKDLLLSLYISENIVDDLKKSDLIEKFKLVDLNRCTKIVENLQDRLIIDLGEDEKITDNYIYKVIDSCISKNYFVKLEMDSNTSEVFPISFVLKKEGLYLYCVDDEHKYNLIFTKNINKACECQRYYTGSIIQYNDNKTNL